MKCTICKKEIVLSPSAEERAKKLGGTPAYYRGLFTTHSECAIHERNREAVALIRRINKGRDK